MPLSIAIPLVASGIGLLAQIFGGVKSGKAFNEAQGQVQAQEDELRSWYDTEMNRDFLGTNVAKSALSNVLDNIERNNKTIESTAAITGASDASTLAQKASNQSMYGDVVKNLASYGTQRQDSVEGRYRANLGQILGQKTNLALGEAQNAGNLVTSGGNLLGSAGELFGLTKWGGS